MHFPYPSALGGGPRTVGVTHHRVLWSPDFPLLGTSAEVRKRPQQCPEQRPSSRLADGFIIATGCQQQLRFRHRQAIVAAPLVSGARKGIPISWAKQAGSLRDGQLGDGNTFVPPAPCDSGRKGRFPAEDPLTLSRADVTMNVFPLRASASRSGCEVQGVLCSFHCVYAPESRRTVRGDCPG